VLTAAAAQVGAKQMDYTIGEAVVCPTEAAPFLFTARNSGK
jgi:hypothetical protein